MDGLVGGAQSESVALGRAIAAALAATNTTQKRAAELTGIPQGRISAIISNYRGERATIDEIVKLEEALGLPRGYVLAFAGIVTPMGAKRGAAAAEATDQGDTPG
jgi:predicted XRE-type DNA-binding protein